MNISPRRFQIKYSNSFPVLIEVGKLLELHISDYKTENTLNYLKITGESIFKSGIYQHPSLSFPSKLIEFLPHVGIKRS